MTNQKIQVLQDRFSQGSLNTALWSSVGTPSFEVVSIPIDVSSGTGCGSSIGAQLYSEVASFTAGSAETSSSITSVNLYDATDSGISVQLTSFSPASAGSYIDASFGLYDQNSPPNYIIWLINHPPDDTSTIGTITHPGGALGTAVIYNPAQHQFFRIYENSGTVYCDYSADSLSWINHSSITDPFDMTGVYAGFGSDSGPISWANIDYVLVGS